MSNTKQQIEEMISDFGEDSISYGEELHTGRVKSDEEIKADSAELLQKQTEIFEAIDRLVTEARLEELDRLFTTKRINGDQIINQTTFNYILDREAQLKNNTTKQEEE